MDRKFLGWDCANRTLAWAYVDIDVHIYTKISILADSLNDLIEIYCGPGFVKKMRQGLSREDRNFYAMTMDDPDFFDQFTFIIGCLLYFTGQFMTPIYLGVKDVIAGRKVNDVSLVDRTRALCDFLTRDAVLCDASGYVVIEHQPIKIGSKVNNKSTVVSHQLVFYYTAGGNSVSMVDPKLKNNFVFRDDITYQAYLSHELPRHKDPRNARYIARKKHSRDNFLYLLDVFGGMAAVDDISAAVMDDVADAAMGVFAHLISDKLFR